MKCSKCKKDVPKSSKFCIFCGINLKTGQKPRSFLVRLIRTFFAVLFWGTIILFLLGGLIVALPGLFQLYKLDYLSF